MNAIHKHGGPSAWQIEKALVIALTLRERLLAEDPTLADDEGLLTDILDGETGALDIARRLIRFSLDARSTAEAAAARMRDLYGRQLRFERRAEAAKTAATEMLTALGQTKLEDAEFTASIGKGKPRVVITGPVAAEYTRTTETPDKAAIHAALAKGETVENAMLSNAAPVLTVRTK